MKPTDSETENRNLSTVEQSYLKGVNYKNNK